MFKQEKGITLVSLVITIIVMLILAGVSLSMVMGEGSVLNQATTAVDTTELSSVKDEVGLALGAAQTNYYAQYSNTTGRKDMNECILDLDKSEFTAAAAVKIHAPASGTGALVYYLGNGNVYQCDLTITANSVTQSEIKRVEKTTDLKITAADSDVIKTKGTVPADLNLD